MNATKKEQFVREFYTRTGNKHLLEGYDDGDDDLSPAERALIAKADKDLKKQGVKVKDFDADKMVGASKKAKPEEDDDVEQKKPAKAAPSAASTSDAGGDRKRGDKSAAARKFLADNPDARRRDFVKFIAGHGVSAAYANTMFYALKKNLREVFFITNEEGQVLAEGDVWTVFEDYGKRLQMFKSEWNAKKKTLRKGGTVKRFAFESERLNELSPETLTSYAGRARSQ